MGNSKRNNKSEPWQHTDGYKKDHHVRIYDDMYDSVAWRALSGCAAKQLIAIHMQYRSRNGQKKAGKAIVSCPYKEMKGIGIKSNSTISKNLAELEALGFIVIEHGGLYNPNTYILSDKWKCIGSIEEAEKILAKMRTQQKAEAEKKKKAQAMLSENSPTF